MKDRQKRLREKLAETTAQMRSILETAEKEGRAKLNSEEEGRYVKAEADVTELEGAITREIELEKREDAIGQTVNPHEAGREERTDPKPKGGTPAEAGEIRGMPETRDKRFENFHQRLATLPEAHRAGILRRASDEYRAAFRSALAVGMRELAPGEKRALQADADISGGTLVAPIQFVAQLLKFVDDQVFLRKLGTVWPGINAQSMGVPTLDADPADFDWTSELGTGSEDSTMATGRRELKPHPLAKRIKVSNKLLRISVLDAETLVRQRLGYKIAISQEKAFISGSGAEQPLGVFTASSDGIPTTRDVVTGSATALTADGLFDAFYTLKAAYMANATWLFHRDAIRQIRKLKDTTNNYLWQPSLGSLQAPSSLANGQPSTILDRPFVMSEYVPNTFTTGLYVGLVGDFSFYWIADSLEMTIQRLVELYAETNQTGFISRMETDGAPVLAEAFVRIKTS
jgi:HK97 family phage major capsid protein